MLNKNKNKNKNENDLDDDEYLNDSLNNKNNALSSFNNKITLTKKSFSRKQNLSKLSDDEISDLTNFINPDSDLEIELLSKTTSKISALNYGPLLTIFDFDSLCKNLCEIVSELKDDYNQLFFQFYHILMGLKSEAFQIKNKNVMILKGSYCLLISFRFSKLVTFCLNLTTKVTYNTYQNYVLPYNEKLLPQIKEFYKNNLIKYVDRILSRMKMDSTNFENDMDEKINNCMKKYKDNLERTNILEDEREKLTDEILELELKKKERKEKNKEKMKKLRIEMFQNIINPYEDDDDEDIKKNDDDKY